MTHGTEKDKTWQYTRLGVTKESMIDFCYIMARVFNMEFASPFESWTDRGLTHAYNYFYDRKQQLVDNGKWRVVEQ